MKSPSPDLHRSSPVMTKRSPTPTDNQPKILGITEPLPAPQSNIIIVTNEDFEQVRAYMHVCACERASDCVGGCACMCGCVCACENMCKIVYVQVSRDISEYNTVTVSFIITM